MIYLRFSGGKFAIIIAIFAAIASTTHVKAATPASCAAATKSAQDAIKLDGKRFTVVIEGSGPDVILIPGLASPREVWAPTVAALSKCYRFHTVQIRGFGDDAGINADGPVLEPFIKELADYIDDTITDKGKARPAIIGHSMGGLAALMLGAHYPQETGKIMVVDAVPFFPTIFNPAATVDLAKPQAEAMAAMIRSQYKPDKAIFDGKDPGEFSQAGRLSNTARGRITVARWTQISDMRVVAQALYDDMITDMRSELPKIAATVTLLYAQDDKAMSPEQAKAAFEPQYAGTAHFEAHRVSGSYHFIMLDQPERFAGEVLTFLKK
jgi:pimeloyl-ACP methyl ester carboxylesterase